MDATSCLERNLPSDLVAWLEAHDDLADAWRSCPHAHWLIHMALAVEVDRSLVVHAAADVASAALSRARPDDPTAHRALRIALAWLDGRASSSQAWAIGFSASEAADHEPHPIVAAAMRSAAFVAFACDDLADASFYAHRGYAAKAAEAAALALATDDIRAADRVRARIPLPTFLSAYDVASRPPPPLPEPEGDAEPPSDSFYA